MTIHAENAKIRPRIFQVLAFYYPLAVHAPEAGSAKGLLACQDG
jgi:hypothetical protein